MPRYSFCLLVLIDMSASSHAYRWHTRRPRIHYVPLGFSIDEALPRVPALETLRGEPMNFAAIGVAAAARLGMAASRDNDMKVGSDLSGTGRLRPTMAVLRAG